MHHTTVELILLALIPVIGVIASSYIAKSRRIPVRIKANEERLPESRS